MRVSDVLSKKPVAVSADASLDEAMQLMDDHGLRHLPVLEGERVVGVISDRDLLELTGWLHPRVREILDAPSGPVRQYMHSPPVTVTADRPLTEAVTLLVEQGIGCLPVVEDGALHGIVTGTDLMRAFREGRGDGRIPVEADPLVSSVMTSELSTTTPSARAEDAMEAMRELGFRHLPVLDGDALVGIVSDRDLRLAVGRGDLENVPVSDFMTADPITIGALEPVSAAAARLLERGVNALPVVAEGRLVGIATLRDVLGACCEGLQQAPARQPAKRR